MDRILPGFVKRSLIVIGLALCPQGAAAQNWSFDARAIALGSPTGGRNLASDMVAEANGYRAIVLPFGLIQVVGDIDALNPSNDSFDLVRAMEDVASPLHYTFHRHATSTGQAFVVDLRNADLNRDLNMYRGFVPANQPRAEGVAAPVWGRAITVHRDQSGASHGIYVGVGPYVSMQTDLAVDDQLIRIFGASSSTTIPNTTIRSSTALRGQIAAAIVAGYRGRFVLPEATSARDGIYVAVNYNVLRGIRYEDLNVGLRLDTDPLGLLTVNSQLPAPLSIARDHATSGWGRALDVGLGATKSGWQVGFGANGLANRIVWTRVQRTSYALANPITGNADFVEQTTALPGKARITLPAAYNASLSYGPGAWTAIGDVSWGLGGAALHGGYEYRLSGVALRAGALYVRELWNPTGGVGINLSPRTALDIGFYGNAANAERNRHLAVAVSVRVSAATEDRSAEIRR